MAMQAGWFERQMADRTAEEDMGFWSDLFGKGADPPIPPVPPTSPFNKVPRDTKPVTKPAPPAVPPRNLLKEAFGAVPAETLTAIADNAGQISPTVRGLLLALMASPNDRACWMALTDYAMEMVQLPQYVTFNGEKIAIEHKLPYSWWCNRSGLHLNAVNGLFKKLGAGRSGTYWYDRHIHKSLRLCDVCALTASQVRECDGFGAVRLKQLREWLGALGLHLSGAEVKPPEENDDRHETGPTAGSGGESGG